MQCRLRDRRSRLFSLGLRPCPLRTEIPPDSLNLLIMLCTVEGEISKSLPIFLWGTLFLNISIIFSRICWQTGDPRPIFAPKGLDLSWMLLLYQIIITITCWHQLFQITSLFNQFTSLLALNCSCPNFFWNVLQVWMTGKDVYFPYCPNFFWFGVVYVHYRSAQTSFIGAWGGGSDKMRCRIGFRRFRIRLVPAQIKPWSRPKLTNLLSQKLSSQVFQPNRAVLLLGNNARWIQI